MTAGFSVFVLFLAISFIIKKADLILPVTTGYVISLANVIIGSLIIYRAFKISGKGFFNIVLMSMVVRLFAISGVVFILIYFLRLEKISLVSSMFFFYFLFLIFEIGFISKAHKK